MTQSIAQSATQIHFHLLPEGQGPSRSLYACQLIEQAYTASHPVTVQTGNESESAYLDRLLWTFSDASFVPHVIFEPNQTTNPTPASETCPPPVTIHHHPDSSNLLQLTNPHTLVNLTHSIPDFYNGFEHIIEIIPSDPAWRELGRQHYRVYKEAGNEVRVTRG